jgi:phosphonate transport system substrate-binding protein
MKSLPFLAMAVCLLATSATLAGEKEATPIVQMGMIQSLFRGSETGALLAQTSPLGDMLLSQSDMKGQVSVVTDPDELVQQVQKGDLHIAVIHGIEYAWVRDKYPDVKPLVLAVNRDVQLKALILVREDSKIQSLADLHGKPFSFHRRAFNHVYLYLHHAIQEAGFEPTAYFAPSPTPANNDQAIESVIDGTTDGTIIDAVSWSVYCQRKPGRAKRLRAIQESGWFPTATVIYNAKNCDPKLMDKVREALLNSNKNMLGRQMLTLWRLTQFSEIPKEYEPLLASSVKAYPAIFKPATFVTEPAKLTAVPSP